MATARKIEWVGSAKKDLVTFSEPVINSIGMALNFIQHVEGAERLPGVTIKQMKGLASDGVMEIVTSFRSNVYRAIYAIKIDDAIYVPHCFQKKSTEGIKTPKPVINVINSRLKEAKEKSNGK